MTLASLWHKFVIGLKSVCHRFVVPVHVPVTVTDQYSETNGKAALWRVDGTDVFVQHVLCHEFSSNPKTQCVFIGPHGVCKMCEQLLLVAWFQDFLAKSSFDLTILLVLESKIQGNMSVGTTTPGSICISIL